MNLLVFAHTPPPHHGQSFMVKLLLDGLQPATVGKTSPPIRTHHVNCRFSDEVSDIGQVQWKKILLLFRYCIQAIALRLRHGPMLFYYVPALGLRSAIYRDWLVMALCRPFFSKRVFHWHGVGLGEWLEANGKPWEKWITKKLLGDATLSLVLGEFYRNDVARFAPRTIQVVANGIPDPCPEFDPAIRSLRSQRCALRSALIESGNAACPGGPSDPAIFRVLFLSLCMREKGVFDAVEAVALANRHPCAGPVRFELTVAGNFYRPEEKVEFEQRLAAPELKFTDGTPMVRYAGFADASMKRQLFRDSDALIFPSFYPMEGQPVSVIEAMAWGLPVVATRWRSVPELFPADYPGLANPQAPGELAVRLLRIRTLDVADAFRSRFLANYTAARFADKMKVALLTAGGEIRPA